MAAAAGPSTDSNVPPPVLFQGPRKKRMLPEKMQQGVESTRGRGRKPRGTTGVGRGRGRGKGKEAKEESEPEEEDGAYAGGGENQALAEELESLSFSAGPSQQPPRTSGRRRSKPGPAAEENQGLLETMESFDDDKMDED